MSPLRILIADAQDLIADGLRMRLDDLKRYRIVGHARTGVHVLERLAQEPVDLLLMDVSLPGSDGIDTMRAVHRLHPRVKVLGHSLLYEIEYVNSMLIEGASGYLLKGGPHEELLLAIDTVMSGRCYLSPLARKSVESGYAYTDKRVDGAYVGLTEREREIIRMVAQERTNEEIADDLGISPETVKSHRKKLMTKLNVRNAAGLVKYAVDRCWI
ncbi:MAG: response regulator transcription factor [Flavobacteriales bacterium]|nr:response regulator transcription factor [Flavobacteriales bacterium]MCB9166254.1 response regulator transcription factor [Flavobacteriales bacterium]